MTQKPIVKIRKAKPKVEAKPTEPPDTREELPPDEYRRRIQALDTSAAIAKFRAEFRRGA